MIEETLDWLASQQELDGGFAPWKKHPVGSNIYCTAVSMLGMLKYIHLYPQYQQNLEKAYNYICSTQLPNGLWPYHEIEDGAAWGLRALNLFEEWRKTID